jgi:GNAT superfamily N-acetyltransferase
MADQIHVAAAPEDYAAFGALVEDYVEWVRLRYGRDRWIVDAAFGHQSLERELRNLSSSYGPPMGKTLLARRDGAVVGACAYRRLSDDVCEMKRLFVPARYQGTGTGRRLCEALLRTAKRDGFALMRLDTGSLFAEAIQLYRSVGFRPCAAYQDYPSELQPFMVFMEREL